MKVENFSKEEWLKIADIISSHCPSEPLIEKLIQVINDRTNLFSYTHDFFIKNKFNPIFFPLRPAIESCKDGKGLMRRLAMYRTINGKGVHQFKKDYQEYILKTYEIKTKEIRS